MSQTQNSTSTKTEIHPITIRIRKDTSRDTRITDILKAIYEIAYIKGFALEEYTDKHMWLWKHGTLDNVKVEIGKRLKVIIFRNLKAIAVIDIDPDDFDSHDCIYLKLDKFTSKLGFAEIARINDDPESEGVEYYANGYYVQIWDNCECNPSREQCRECEPNEVVVIIKQEAD